MVSDYTIFTNKGCKIAAKKKFVFGQIFHGSGYHTTRIRRLYNKDQEAMFSDAIIEPLQKTLDYKGCYITAQKNKLFFFCKYCFTSWIFWYWFYHPHQSRDSFVSHMWDFFTWVMPPATCFALSTF